MKQKSNSLVLLIVIGFIFIVSCATITQTNISIFSEIDISNANTYQKDLIYLSDKLKSAHPYLVSNKFKFIDEEQFKAIAINTYNHLDSIENDLEANYVFRSFLSKLNDYNTVLKQEYDKDIKCLPINFRWFGDDLYILNGKLKYKDTFNKKVISIGNMDVTTIKNKTIELFSADNTNAKIFKSANCINEQHYLQYLGLIDENENVSIEYEANGEYKTVILPVNMKKIGQTISNYYSKVANIGRNNITQSKNEKIRYKTLPEFNSTYLQIKNFNIYDWEDFNYKYEKLFKDLKKHNIKYLIVDLRTCRSSYPQFIYRFLSYIKNKNNININTYERWIRPSKEYYLSMEQ